MKSRISLLIVVLLATMPLIAAELKQEAADAFARYATAVEDRQQKQMASGKFLFIDTLPDGERNNAYARIKNGEVYMHKIEAGEVPSGVIHDWIGTVFVPGATLKQAQAFMQDYNVHSNYYKPDMTQSKLIAHNGDDFKIFFRLYKSKFGVTANINSYMDVRYFYPDSKRLRTVGRSTKTAEVEKPDTPNEKELAPGNDHGFLWRLNSYWCAEERDGGVYISSEAVTLTRTAMWPVGAFIKSGARDSLESTLRNVRTAIPQHTKTARR